MTNEQEQPEFWEKNFSEKKEMWGLEPSRSALKAKDIFLAQGAKSILVPGFGYGRNAQLFREEGMQVTGIEISASAIAMAEKHYGPDMKVYHGSVTDMPFDEKHYDGIFCYGLIHLLGEQERLKLIRDCYSQLADKGQMIFTTISKKAATYGTGTPIGKDRFEQFGGVTMFFYDQTSIEEEFGSAGLEEISDITENFPFYFIRCRKK
ncbi:MAG TPA: class I SAM-dependent methyltransferase [Chitinophagaceae bacterium]|nr:class I SAM-dependent methyltransferase [Chitinophagaceae bacterium]